MLFAHFAIYNSKNNTAKTYKNILSKMRFSIFVGFQNAHDNKFMVLGNLVACLWKSLLKYF